MGKGTSVEDALAKLRAIRPVAGSDGGKAELRKALAGRTNLVAAKAAEVVAEAGLKEFAEDLAAAFDRFMPEGKDKGCAAKTAIAKALYELGCDAESVFLPGVRHVQMEAAWGGPSDAAAELRGICAMGLVRMGYRDVMTELADLLADREGQARVAAARAIGYAEREEGALLLRLKLLSGDGESEVMGEAMAALMKLSPGKAPQFVARFLDSPDESLRQMAAAAIGTSRRREAFELLRARWEGTIQPETRRLVLAAMGPMRLPEAMDFMLGVIREGNKREAAEAVEAMRAWRHDEAVKAKVAAAVVERDEADVKAAFEKYFGG